MQLNIVNESSYKNLKIICNGKTFSLNKENAITSLDIDNNTNVEIQVFEKNRVLLNLLFALVDGFVDGESVINSLVCDLSFDICETDDLQTLIIKDLEYRDDKNGYIYESVYIENINVSNLVYRLTNTAKTRKKAFIFCSHKFLSYNIFISFGKGRSNFSFIERIENALINIFPKVRRYEPMARNRSVKNSARIKKNGFYVFQLYHFLSF